MSVHVEDLTESERNELSMLRAMKEALDRAAVENSTEGDPTELALRVKDEVTSQPYSVVYALANQVIRDHQHTLQLLVERDQLRRMHDGVSADLDRERREHQEAMAEAAARELKLTEERDELSERYNRAADDLQAAVEQAEHDAHKLLDADELAMENLRLERLVKQLTSKVKRREDDIKRYRAELAKKSKAAAKRSRRKS